MDHPGRDHLLRKLDLDVDSCLYRFVEASYDTDVLFIKNMAHHLEGIGDRTFLRRLHNIFLIRDPEQMLPSLIRQIPHPQLLDTAYERQHQLYSELRSEGHDPLIIDSRELLLNPPAILEQVCQQLNIPYISDMLSWKAGPRTEDGPWAPHWYHNVHTSTGFQLYRHKTEPLPKFLQALLRECQPYYQALYEHALKAPDHD